LVRIYIINLYEELLSSNIIIKSKTLFVILTRKYETLTNYKHSFWVRGSHGQSTVFGSTKSFDFVYFDG